jgi:hypothetical protein
MGVLRGLVSGSLGLIVLYDVTAASSNKTTAAGLKSAASMPGRFAHYIVDPNTPLVPDLRPGALKNLPNGGSTQTNKQGDQIYTDPKGHQFIGGPGGIPVPQN